MEEENKITKELMMPCLIEAVKKVSTWKNIDPIRLKKQISVSLNIIDGLVLGKTNFILNLPTGFGKSILALLVDEMFKIATTKNILKSDSTYLLAPNKFLQDQYQDDIIKFELSKTHSQLKGQSNYECLTDNTKTFYTRPCVKYSIKQLKDGKMSCGGTCPYIVARDTAIVSKTTIFNYSYWLTSMNKNYEYMAEIAPFKPRGLTIFDECHTIANIVQNMFETKFDFNKISYELESNFNLLKNIYGASMVSAGDITSDEIDLIASKISDIRKSNQTLSNYVSLVKNVVNIEVYENILDEINSNDARIKAINKIYSYVISRSFPDLENPDTELTDTQQSIYDSYTYMNTLIMDIDILVDMYKTTGIDSMVVDFVVEEDKDNKTKTRTISFRCVKDDELIKKHVLKYTQYSIFMSATIGDNKKDLETFAFNHGIENYKIISSDSDFDFSDSPIIMTTPFLNMGNKEKDENMPKLLDRVELIVMNHPKEAGLIHTGNYEFMHILKKHVENKKCADRFIWCDTAEKKIDAVNLLKWDIQNNGWTNRILVGASLLEGVDLKDDLCRFNVFMKVPYLSMLDALVKRKMALYPNWYGWTTMVSFLQGIGRSNRHKNDKSTVYLLDGSFKNFFFYYGLLPKIIAKRLIYTELHSWLSNNLIQTHTEVVKSPPMPIIEVTNEEIEYLENDIFAGVK